MTKIEAIRLMEQGKKVTHRYFSANEFATIKNGQIVTEEGCSVPMKEFWAYRNVEGWSDGWEEFVEKKTTPSPASGSLELNHAARDYAEKLLEGYDGEHGPHVFNSYAIQQAFLAGAGYSKGGEENQDWPPNVWQLGNGAQSHLHGKWCYAYRDSEGLNQHQYPFDTEAEAIEDYRKRFFPSNPSLDIDKVVERLRKANPYKRHFDQRAYSLDIWYKACDKLKELLNQPK